MRIPVRGLLLALAVMWSGSMLLYAMTLPDHKQHHEEWKPKRMQV
jgi:hypothetical protein